MSGTEFDRWQPGHKTDRQPGEDEDDGVRLVQLLSRNDDGHDEGKQDNNDLGLVH